MTRVLSRGRVEIRSGSVDDLDGSRPMRTTKCLPRSRDRYRRLVAGRIQVRRFGPGPPPCAGGPGGGAGRLGGCASGPTPAPSRRYAELTAGIGPAADPDPWRSRLREVLQTSSGQERLASLQVSPSRHCDRKFARCEHHLLGASLLEYGRPEGCGDSAPRGPALYPGDVWLNYTLAAMPGTADTA